MKELKVKVTFFESVLGMSPANENIYRDFIGSKSPDAANVEEEVEALGAEAYVEKQMTVFPKENGVPFIWDYQIKGFFKDACGGLRKVKGTLSSKEKAYKKTIDKLLFPEPRKIFFENFISPGTYKEYKSTAVDDMLNQLYAKTGDASVLPSSLQKYVTIKGVRKDFSADEYVKAQKKAGTTKYDMLNQLVANKEFKKLPASQQADIISDVYSYGNLKGKQAVSNYTTDTKWFKKMEESQKDGVSKSEFLLAKNHYGNLESKKGVRPKNLKMYDYLIANKNTSAKEDLSLMKNVAGVDFTKYERATKVPEKILSAYELITTEKEEGDGAQQRIIKQLIADKRTTAKEDVAIVEKVLGVNLDKYEKATKNDEQTLYLYNILNTKNAKGEDSEKEADLALIQKRMKTDDYGAREIYAKAKGNWNEDISDVRNNGTNREKKIETFRNFKYSDKDIIAGYNAVIGLTKKDDMINALAKAFGSKNKATIFYNILKGKKGYK